MGSAPSFTHAVEINPKLLRYELFHENSEVRGFDCGNPDLNDFLSTEEVHEYDRLNLGRTTLVYYDNKLVAYYTVSVDGLLYTMVVEKKTAKSYIKLGDVKTDRLPAIKIGRLAVDSKYQNIGIGRYLFRHIIGYAIELSKQTAVRLIIVESKPSSIDFYLKCAFQHTVLTKSERSRRNRTLFFDLQAAIEVDSLSTT